MLVVEAPSLWIREMVIQVLSFRLSVQITGEELLENHGIILSNHLDMIDYTIPLFFLKEKIYILTDSEFLDKNPLFTWLKTKVPFFHEIGQIHVLKENDLNFSLKSLLEKGYVFYFPEKKPSSTGIIQPFFTPIMEVIYEVARQFSVPVYPSGIQGTYQFFQVSNLLDFSFQKFKVQYNIGNPINIKDTPFETFMEQCRKQIYALSLHPERRKSSRILIKTDAREL